MSHLTNDFLMHFPRGYSGQGVRSTTPLYEGVLISPYPDLLPDVVGRNR